MFRTLRVFLMLAVSAAAAEYYTPANEKPPQLAREFRGAWVATVHNIDWPSSKGLGASTQQSQLRGILDKMAGLRMNAVIFQVRPQCDALYQSSHEPWSPWLTGTMGKSPGYDPLEFCIREAHARGIEVHAWFNPFRALTNNSQGTCSSHVTKRSPGITKRFGSMTWCDPASPEARQRAMNAILDVVSRYDVDGVHLDDYFYPYPSGGARFEDGRSPAQRRAIIDGFVKGLYDNVKAKKPWVRVGISPFGIWRPGVPTGIEAELDAYDQLACDSRKWLRNGWVDYLAPQLYWRISPAKQSFPALLGWWREQGSRPVWPGIATERIGGSEDRRPASEITNQIDLSRKIGRNWNGHIHWSAKALVTNKGGIAGKLGSASYTQPALVPPMPWLSKTAPQPPGVAASANGDRTQLRWVPDGRTAKIAVQARYGSSWRTVSIPYVSTGSLSIPRADAIAVSAVDRFGNTSAPKVLGL